MFTAILVAINLLVMGIGIVDIAQKKPGDDDDDDKDGSSPEIPCA
jgi:hypothetical protein